MLPAGGLGLGWRPEIAGLFDDAPQVTFSEVVAENVVALVEHRSPAVGALDGLRERGLPVVTHGVGLSLGSADPADLGDPGVLARSAARLGSPLISEHLAFVRAGGLETGHLLGLPRTREAVDVVVANTRRVVAELPSPFAVEMVAATAVWPEDELSDPQFVTEILERVDVGLVLDIANVYANAHNQGLDAAAELAAYPLERIAYCHIAGGYLDGDGHYRDSHAGPVLPEVVDLGAALRELAPAAPILLERDDRYPPGDGLLREVDELAARLARG